MRFRVAVDADSDQHGPAPMHRSTAVPIATDARAGCSAHRVHMADRVNGIHACAVLVPRAIRPRQHHKRVHTSIPEKRHIQAIHRVHRVRGVIVLRTAPIAVRLSLSTDIPQTQ